MAVCKAMDLAHYIVNKCTIEGEPVSNLQLQKMMYFLQSVYACAVGDGSLLFDEEFEAWPDGPVLSDVYHEYAVYGARSITKRYENIDSDFLGACKEWVDDGISTLRKKSPWDRIWRDGSGYKDTIPNRYILEDAGVCQ